MIDRSKQLVFLAASLTVSLCACGSFRNPRIVELYDLADPAGVIEVEMERDGTIREIEADIPVSELPPNVVTAALERAPGGEVFGAEREYVGGKGSWEVKVRFEGKEWEFVVDESGNVVETEEPIEASEGPDGLVDAARAKAPAGAMLKSVERITVGERVEFHVKLTHEGATYKIVLDDGAKVLRAVREQRAELEIPLR